MSGVTLRLRLGVEAVFSSACSSCPSGGIMNNASTLATGTNLGEASEQR